MTSIKPIAERIEVISRNKIEDDRGWFLKVITGKESGLPAYTGEIYIVYSENGASRGGHYHIEATEWFTILEGVANLVILDIITHEKHEIYMDINEPKTIVIPPKIAHRFDAIDKKSFLVMAYTDKLYKPEDTVSYQL